tara:strand:+ start:367 stop:597 length:231 start_codon:yes stop_codon:yes gene_type:complete
MTTKQSKKTKMKTTNAAMKKKIAKEKRALKRTEDWIEARKEGRNLAKREILNMLKHADKEGYTIADIIAELQRQLK